VTESQPVVQTTSGAVRGHRRHGTAVFRGIPYGSDVTGTRRFQPARPAAPWTGIRDATVTGPRAVQSFGNLFQSRLGDYFTGGHIGELGLNDQVDSENCLVLNVVTPSEGAGARPVMVYLHGGGYSSGSGVIALGAHRLVDEQDVVVVSVNHRLNVFGFCALGTFDERFADSANAGLLDLVLALEWVKENIANFGGDPGNVTIFGESGGGGKVGALLAMPAAAGLFRRAVIESGSILRGVPAEQAERNATALLAALGIGSTDIDRLLEVDTRSLFAASKSTADAFGPVIDGRTLTRHPFDPDAPPTAAAVPLLVGDCDDEVSWFFDGDQKAYELSDGDLEERLAILTTLDQADIGRVLATYRTHDPELSPAQLCFRVLSESSWACNTDRQAEFKTAQDAPVFKYRFRYRTAIEGGIYGAFHTAELPLVFRLTYYPETEKLSRLLSGSWAAFARSGDPSQAELAWPTFTTADRQTMVFDTESGVVADPRGAQRELWQGLPAQSMAAIMAARAQL
jgi:para-nitrobenzyl esterase